MHSSRMCTARLLTVSRSMLLRGVSAGRGVWPGMSAKEGVYQRGCLSIGDGGFCPGDVCPGVSAQRGRSAWEVCPSWTDRHLWKHNLCKLRLWAVTKLKQTLSLFTRYKMNRWKTHIKHIKEQFRIKCSVQSHKWKIRKLYNVAKFTCAISTVILFNLPYFNSGFYDMLNHCTVILVFFKMETFPSNWMN